MGEGVLGRQRKKKYGEMARERRKKTCRFHFLIKTRTALNFSNLLLCCHKKDTNKRKRPLKMYGINMCPVSLYTLRHDKYIKSNPIEFKYIVFSYCFFVSSFSYFND